jgi:hypothetical protein
MKNEIKTETGLTTQTQNLSKQSRIKKWALNLIAMTIGFIVICGALGILDILAQRELKKTGKALPKLFLYRWKSKNKTSKDKANDKTLAQFMRINSYVVHDPLTGPQRGVDELFPNLVEDHLPYIIANYFKIFIRQSDIGKFETHSTMQPIIITPELLNKLERPFIVCLGGSTTEPFLPILKRDDEQNYSIVANGTWSEELSRMLEKREIRGTVFCGGTGWYIVFDDLLKLLRDVLEIKPDIVISYGGVNDLVMRRDFKTYNWISNKYHKEKYNDFYMIRCPLFPNLVRYTMNRKSLIRVQEREFTPMELYGGVKSNLNEAEYMVRNWKIMNEICKLHNIKFYGVLQPCVGSTEQTRNDEKLMSMRWNKNHLHDDTLWQRCFDVLVKNYDLAKPEVLKYDFLYDFSDIFDKLDLNIIYQDWCHVNQEGNCIVAENMFQMLFGESNGTQNDSDK